MQRDVSLQAEVMSLSRTSDVVTTAGDLGCVTDRGRKKTSTCNDVTKDAQGSPPKQSLNSAHSKYPICMHTVNYKTFCTI